MSWSAGQRSVVHTLVLDWFDREGRDLPWRRPEATAWGIYVSEVMAQQTPIARVLPVWQEWMQRWPEPGALAAQPPGAAIQAWQRLGYPRRALRLHMAAGVMLDRHGGQVPSTYAELLALPGVGAYTAAAVYAFAFGGRATVVDTNVRRVLTRIVLGQALPAVSLTRAEQDLATAMLPTADADSVRWNVAAMELGALVCTARSPACTRCPVASQCGWLDAGRPAYQGPPRKGQAWVGTDRQIRGTLLAALRERAGALPVADLLDAWPSEPDRAARCLTGLLADGLVELLPEGHVGLPGLVDLPGLVELP